MAMMRPTYSLRAFESELESEDLPRFPVYAMLLYTPQDGLDERLHTYIRSHWEMMDGLTGANWGLPLIEDLNPAGHPIEEFRPGDVYEIARLLGISVADVPSLVFFTDPRERRETLVLKLKELLPPPTELTDDHLTAFFRDTAAVVDRCVGRPASSRLNCLRDDLRTGLPQSAEWLQQAKDASGWLVSSTVTAATVAQSIGGIVTLLRTLGLF